MTDDLGNALYKRNKTYFPNVNTGAGNMSFPLRPGVAEGRARMDELARTGTYKSRQAALSTYNLPSGGTASVNTGNRVSSYAQPMINPVSNVGTTSFSNPAPNEAMFPTNISTPNFATNPSPSESLFPTNIQQPLFPNIGAINRPAAFPSQLPSPPAVNSRFNMNFSPMTGGGRPNAAMPTPTPQPLSFNNAFGQMRNAINQTNAFLNGRPSQPRRYFDTGYA